MQEKNKLHIAFVVGIFPVLSETFIINQVADLIDRGIEVTIFTFKQGDILNVSDRYTSYNMKAKTRVLQMPINIGERIKLALQKMFRLAFYNPFSLLRALNIFHYGRNALSLKTIFWVEPFLGEQFDLVHCHFGPVANRYLWVKDILRLKQKLIVTG